MDQFEQIVADNKIPVGRWGKIGVDWITANLDWFFDGITEGLRVPIEAVVTFAGVTKLFLIEGGKAKEVQVTLGTQDTKWVEIASPPLAEGAQVVTSGQTAIADGSTVAVREASGAKNTSLAAESFCAMWRVTRFWM